MSDKNLLFIFSDQHGRDFTGCYGHPEVQTPHIDALARRGAMFTRAYTPAPICVPARACLATGRYVHEIDYWDNARPYTGSPASWGHRLQQAGRPVLSIGKLHYRDVSDDVGFDEERLPMHVIGGVGMLFLIVRDPMPSGNFYAEQVRSAGPGESTYTQYDRDITAEAVQWLEQEASRHADTPWALFVSLVAPHPPFIAPDAFHRRYESDRLALPVAHRRGERPEHPAYADLRHFWGIEEPFTDRELRRVTSAYYGLISFLDDNIGRLLAALDRAGLTDSTNIVYTSDHGDSMGHKGLFSKSNFMEQSAAVPMILAGPGVPANTVIDTPASLIDCFPTALEATGVPAHPDDANLRGVSLFALARGEHAERAVLSEQHAAGARHGGFMLCTGRYKYLHYVDYPPILYDLSKDPHELRNVAGDPAYASALSDCEKSLRTLLDPAAVDQRARADQARRVAEAGGVEEVLGQGMLGYTPAPGETPRYGT